MQGAEGVNAEPVALAAVGFGLLLLVVAPLLRDRLHWLKLGAGMFGSLTIEELPWNQRRIQASPPS